MINMSDFELFVLEKENIECHEVDELLGDYVDGELSPSLAKRVAKHINECEYCQEIEGQYRMVIALASEVEDEPMPVEVGRRLRMNLNRRLNLSLPIDSDFH